MTALTLQSIRHGRIGRWSQLPRTPDPEPVVLLPVPEGVQGPGYSLGTPVGALPRYGVCWGSSLTASRYYGDSKPFPVTLNTTAKQMNFLTTENALKDFVVFANGFQWKNYTVSPKATPWVVIGGSYPGVRAAFLRRRSSVPRHRD